MEDTFQKLETDLDIVRIFVNTEMNKIREKYFTIPNGVMVISGKNGKVKDDIAFAIDVDCLK